MAEEKRKEKKDDKKTKVFYDWATTGIPVINRFINFPTIACTVMRTELLFFTMHTVVHSVSRKILHIWHKNGTMKKSEYLERIRSLGSKTLHSTASTTGLVSKSGQSKHSVQMRQEFCKVKCSRISNVMSIHCRESCKRDDRLLNLVMG